MLKSPVRIGCGVAPSSSAMRYRWMLPRSSTPEMMLPSGAHTGACPIMNGIHVRSTDFVIQSVIWIAGENRAFEDVGRALNPTGGQIAALLNPPPAAPTNDTAESAAASEDTSDQDRIAQEIEGLLNSDQDPAQEQQATTIDCCANSINASHANSTLEPCPVSRRALSCV